MGDVIDLLDEGDIERILEKKTGRKKDHQEELYERLPEGMVRPLEHFWTRRIIDAIAGEEGSGSRMLSLFGLDLGSFGGMMEMLDEVAERLPGESGYEGDDRYGVRLSDDMSEYMFLEEFIEKYDSFLYESRSFGQFRKYMEESEEHENMDYWDSSFPDWDRGRYSTS